MYDYIKGKVDYIGPEYIVVENGGIGYQVMTPNPFIFSAQYQKEIQVFLYHYVREDMAAFYGFQTRQEKALFTKLLNVTGIGPKGALAILASGQVDQVVQAIENEDETFLVKFPGVGKKTARQMILDLKGKLENIIPDAFPNLFNEGITAAISQNGYTEELDEAILALKALGYSEKEIQKVAKKLQTEEMTTEQYIKKALQMMLR
ncbi:Holliday junction branch migration protein RuvA [Peribacillus sp. NPDC060186]|uniref:Holliday junction branch migration complex subunit RuvA n=1 Tax=Peribacillus butanolivorans TaxID=421767 RepID=A0AAX0RW48_9BACI|nr:MULTISPECIES: Holliday junction branch migration protein RuvA [Peribacillus]KQU17099.1 ATP-dependent DNA helicase RuvA [Bacillus sp. Leaf13]KRF60861.1 ATP-dependent DNA helicase RuvA [Bacillus sp. Soil768D1]AXN37703.1 Holliday junction branch migration protein RuvA [Peribacillus butanolivorans]MBK5442757.1 Holliday junction branch migration protein RuvA [Peribacillus sp. TH24]MBK5484162.1 Holliday junction branch migration protein RuvA [Peribacillus sp. TH16]